MKRILTKAAAAVALAFAAPAMAQVVFYEHDGFQGRSVEVDRQLGNFNRADFNDRASSVVVLDGRWEMCTDRRFEGDCVVVRPGRYPSLRALGLNDSVSSVRPVSREMVVEERRYAPPPPMPVYDNRRRDNERLYEARVTSVRAVYGQNTQQRCWTERETHSNRGASVGGAAIGGILGGVLGHQIGSGRGNDLATAAGAIGGAVLGSNVARDRAGNEVRDVQRCENVPTAGSPEFYDVTYVFEGQEHRIQTTVHPGQTVLVNRSGEPRAQG